MGDPEAAVAAGTLSRRKVRNRWIFLDPDLGIDDVLREAERAATSCLAEWLLGSNPYLPGAAAKRAIQPEITSKAMGILINELCVQGRVDGLGLLSQAYQPYLAYFAPADREEVEGQVEGLRDLLAKRGRAGWHDLKETSRSRPGRAWRQLILAHGEFLGLGHLASPTEIIAWR